MVILMVAPFALAQEHPTVERGFHADKVYQLGGIDSVNVFNGNVLVTPPIGGQYTVSAGLSYTISLRYNLKMWEYIQEWDGIENKYYTRAFLNRTSNAGIGWTISGRLNATAGTNPFAFEYVSPDGASHGLYPNKHNTEPPSLIEQGVWYTRDGSHIRVKRINSTRMDVEFPDGIVHEYEVASSKWRLREMRDQMLNSQGSAVNWVRFSYQSTSTKCTDEVAAWIVTDAHNRRHDICFKNQTYDGTVTPTVSEIVLNGFEGAEERYAFAYTQVSAARVRIGNNAYIWDSNTVSVPTLTSITLPDASKYEFKYWSSATADGAAEAHIEEMKYPTGGKVRWEYTTYQVVSTEACSSHQSDGFWMTSSNGLRHKKQYDEDGTLVATWEYRPLTELSGTAYECTSGENPTQGDPTGTSGEIPGEQFTVTVITPDKDKTVHYFSVWPGYNGHVVDSPGGFKANEYGLPFSRRFSLGGRFLSTETFDCVDAVADNCPATPQRRTYVNYERDDPSIHKLEDDRRLKAQRTVYVDDGATYVDAEYGSYDGHGNYRTTTVTGDFGPIAKTTDTNYNPQSNALGRKSDGTRAIGSGDPWILGKHSEATLKEGSTLVARTNLCFSSNGLLKGKRVLSKPSGTGASDDLITLYGHDVSGNVSREDWFGGDTQDVSAITDLCAAREGSHYRRTHSYTAGTLSSRHVNARTGDRASMLQVVNNEVDTATGLVTSSTDPSGVVTSYAYGPMLRLSSVSSPGSATVTYEYKNAGDVGYPLATVLVNVDSDGTPNDSQQKIEFDGLGRVKYETRPMSATVSGTRETRYDAMGRPWKISEWETVPAHFTAMTYDAHGRPVTTTTPDGKQTSIAYAGARTATRTFSFAGTGSTETTTARREKYDHLGRLSAVTENVDLNPADGIAGELTTDYTYDIAGRLVSVSMPGAAGTQTRAFTYDARGLLTADQHPEIGANGNGTTTYSLYDARGHAGRKAIGTDIDLRFEYDAAERLIRVRDAKNASRDLELFSWDCIRLDVTEPCTTVTHRGQLAASARYNYDPELGTIAVNQSNQYDSVTRRLVRRDYTVGNGVVGGDTRFTGESFFFTQSHNDLGLLDTVSYPCRFTPTGCPSSDPGRTVAHGYAKGNLKSVGTWASSITYRANGTIDTITHGTGTSATLEKWEADVNGMARPKRIYSTNASGTQELWSSGNYEFDGSGNVKKIGTTSYSYDPFGRLSAWTTTFDSSPGSGYSTTNRAYDAFGNHLFSTYKGCGPTPNPRCYSTSVLAREMRGTTNRYMDTSYDSAGNVVLDADQRAYTWDPLGMMTSATVNGRTFRYLYDANDERIAAVERVPVSAELRNRTTFTLRGSGNQLLSTWTDDWTSGSRVFTRKEDTIWRGSQVLARAYGSDTMNYTLDHLGSPRLITNGAGAVQATQTFEPFGGGGLYGSGALQFTGHERDQANLGGGVFNLPDYMHARFYDKAGRFLSVDPLIDKSRAARNPKMWNRYPYGQNNPLSMIDPDGRASKDFRVLTVPVNVIYSSADRPVSSSGTMRQVAERGLANARNIFNNAGIAFKITRYEADLTPNQFHTGASGNVRTAKGDVGIGTFLSSNKSAVNLVFVGDLNKGSSTDGPGTPAVFGVRIDKDNPAHEIAHQLGNVLPVTGVLPNTVADIIWSAELLQLQTGIGFSELFEQWMRSEAEKLDSNNAGGK